MVKRWLSIACIALWFVCVRAVDVQSLDSDSFTQLATNGTWFIEYFAPWCPHCQRLAPTWQELADYVHHQGYDDTFNFHVAQIDCTQHGQLCTSHGIRYYPTMTLYRDGRNITEYTSHRSFEALKAFVEGQLEPSSIPVTSEKEQERHTIGMVIQKQL